MPLARYSPVVVALTAASLLPGAALAQEVPPPVTIAATVSLVSDYRFRGVSRSEGDPAIQGGMTVTHESGIYAGTWASSIDLANVGGSATYGSAELDLFGGWSGEVAPGLTADAGLLYYAYPGGHLGKAEFFEPYASLSTTYGPIKAKLGINYAWSQDGLGNHDNVYVYANADLGVPATPLTVSAHVGHQDGPLSGPWIATGSSRRGGWDYALGVSASLLGRLSVGASYVALGGPSVHGLTDDRLVGTLSVAF